MQAGVRLLAVERRRRISGEKIRIARNEIVVGMAPVDVGMDRGVARAGVEQGAAFETAVTRGRGSQDLRLPAAQRRSGRNAVVGRVHDAADRLRR